MLTSTLKKIKGKVEWCQEMPLLGDSNPINLVNSFESLKLRVPFKLVTLGGWLWSQANVDVNLKSVSSLVSLGTRLYFSVPPFSHL